MTKVLTIGDNGAQLKENGRVLWDSTEDESFCDEFPDEVLTEDDLEDILEYLVDEDHLTEAEADEVECEEEGPADDEDEDEDNYDDEYVN